MFYSKLRKLLYQWYKKQNKNTLKLFEFNKILKKDKMLWALFSYGKINKICWVFLKEQFEFLDKGLIDEISFLIDKGKLTASSLFLDIGCGLGINLNSLIEQKIVSSSNLFAMDIRNEVEFNNIKKENIFVGDISRENLVSEYNMQNRFDFVYGMGLLSMVEDLDTVFSNLIGLVKEGGYVFLDSYEPNGETFMPKLGKIKNVELGAHWVSRLNHFKAYYKKYSSCKTCSFVLPLGYIKFIDTFTRVVKRIDSKSSFRVFRKLWLVLCKYTSLYTKFTYTWYSKNYIKSKFKKKYVKVEKTALSDISPKYYILAKKVKI